MEVLQLRWFLPLDEETARVPGLGLTTRSGPATLTMMSLRVFIEMVDSFTQCCNARKPGKRKECS